VTTKLEIGDTITVDEMPPDFSNGDTITRITENEVVVRTPTTLWVANRLPTPTVLDAEYISEECRATLETK
jgi:hypothetical protein